jgi:hypothetical protein
MRKKDIRPDATPAVTASDPVASAPLSDIAKPEELKLEAPTVEPKAEAPKLDIPKIEGKIDLPKLEAAIVAKPEPEAPRVEAPKIDPAKLAPTGFELPRPDQRKLDPPKPDALKFDPLKTAAAFQAKRAGAAASPTTDEAPRSRTNRFPLLAASVALAAAFGAVLGSLAMAGVSKFTAATPAAAAPATTFAAATAPAAPAAPAPTRTVAVVDPQWKETIARVRSDIATLKAELEASNKAMSAHFSKIGDRIDRTERAQPDPAKIARIIETLNRIELRTTAAAVAAPPAVAPAATPAAAAAPPAPDTTGSVGAKPPVVDGWVLRQVFDGFALIEGFNGRLFEVGPGSNIPGVGRVEAIRRVEGQWVVLTPKGAITR